DRSNGAVLWTHASSGAISSIAAATDGIFVSGSHNEAPPTSQTGFIKRLQRADGQAEWTIALTNAVAGNVAIGEISVYADRVLASGVSCPFDEPANGCKVSFWNTTTSGVPANIHSPTFPMRSFGRATLASADTTIAAAIESGAQGKQIRVKRISNTDG